MTIQERVEAGAAWLDVNRPGWVDRINLDRLIMSSKCGCILGQVDGDYFEAIKALDVDEVTANDAAELLGFQICCSSDYGYGELEVGWRDYVTARRAAVLPHGSPHCSCVIPCETCGADTASGYLAGCEECSERRQCGYDRAEFGDVPAIIPGGAA